MRHSRLARINKSFGNPRPIHLGKQIFGRPECRFTICIRGSKHTIDIEQTQICPLFSLTGVLFVILLTILFRTERLHIYHLNCTNGSLPGAFLAEAAHTRVLIPLDRCLDTGLSDPLGKALFIL